MTVTVASNGRILLPVKIRRQDDVLAGQKFEIQRIASGEYRLKRVNERRNEGLVDWLLACPEKGWLHPMEFPETTDDIHFSFE